MVPIDRTLPATQIRFVNYKMVLGGNTQAPCIRALGTWAIPVHVIKGTPSSGRLSPKSGCLIGERNESRGSASTRSLSRHPGTGNPKQQLSCPVAHMPLVCVTPGCAKTRLLKLLCFLLLLLIFKILIHLAFMLAQRYGSKFCISRW